MPLPDHLEPKTYWEKRAELMEESVWRLTRILMQSMPAHTEVAVHDHLKQWAGLIEDLTAQHQEPPAPAAANPPTPAAS